MERATKYADRGGSKHMGFFDKLKDKAKGVAGDALQAAVETAQDKVKDAVADKVTDVAQQAVGGALSHVGATPDSAAANVAQAAPAPPSRPA